MTGAGDRLAWLLSLGLAAAGGLAAHGLAYRVAEPHDERREHLLEQTGHGYLDPVLVASLCAALVVVGFAGRVLASAGRVDRPPLWLFALAPPIGFALQEHVERALHHDTILLAALEPTFVAGLLLQLPFALAALLTARALFAAADAVARQLGSPPRARLAPDASLALPGTVWIPTSPTLIGARGQRAPPLERQL
ncbi:MAG: hypothetical protein ACRDMU_01105 [Gaiellaceae bacterium]